MPRANPPPKRKPQTRLGMHIQGPGLHPAPRASPPASASVRHRLPATKATAAKMKASPCDRFLAFILHRRLKHIWRLVFLLTVTLAPPLVERGYAQRTLAGETEIRQDLEQLATVGSVMMIGAHPDDENTALLAYFSRGRHMRTAYLSLTRGEGGQNLIGSEQGDATGRHSHPGTARRAPHRRRRAISSRAPSISDSPKLPTKRCPSGRAIKSWATSCGTSAASGPM